MPLPVVLSGDELRAAAHLIGLSPLPAFDTGWVTEEIGVANAVALRGLLARGLVTIRDSGDSPDIALTTAADAALKPLLQPEAVVELSRESRIGGRFRQLAAESDGMAVFAREREPSVWDIRQASGSPEQAIRPVALSLLDEHAASPVPGEFVVTMDLLEAARKLLAQGGAAFLPKMLGDHGIPAPERLAAALADVSVTVTMRLSRRLGPSTHLTAVLTWLDAGLSGIWLAEPIDEAADPDDDDANTRAVALVGTDSATVRARIEEMLWQS